ncbi:MAG: aspartate kinase [Thermoplasmata archaeon]
MSSDTVVVKFGGAALGHLPEVTRYVRTARHEEVGLVVVVSARRGVTDLLLDALNHPRGKREHRTLRPRLEQLHPDLPPAGIAHLTRVDDLLRQVERHYPKDLPLADRLLSQGERLAVHWLASHLEAEGIPAVPVEADRLGLVTDNGYGASLVLFDRSRRPVRKRLGRLLEQGKVPIVTGFFGRSLEGRVAILGRGGSDYSASAIGAILHAPRVELVKSEAAVLSADPRQVPGARPIEKLSYEEAEELAQFGAKILHPLTIEPARREGVEIWVRSLESPSVVTRIMRRDSAQHARAITLLDPLRLLRVRVAGGRQRPGIIAAVTNRLASARLNLIALFTSAALLSLLLHPAESRTARQVLAPVLKTSGAVLEGPLPVALVTAIGDGILADLGRIPPSILERVEGFSATSRSVSLAVPHTYGISSLRGLHAALVEENHR